MNWIIVGIFLCVGPFFSGPAPKKSPGAQKKIIFWGQKNIFFIYFLAELDNSKTFFFSKKKNIFLGGSQKSKKNQSFWEGPKPFLNMIGHVMCYF